MLEKGTDPRTEDNEGTTPFDLAKDDEIRSILHEAMIERDTKEDSSGESIKQVMHMRNINSNIQGRSLNLIKMILHTLRNCS